MAEHPKKAEFIAAAQRHMAAVGSTNWKDLLSNFPDIPEPTKWRWIKLAKEADVSRPELINARAKLVQKVKKLPADARTSEARENGTEHIAKHLPASPRPEYIARNGESGLATLDFVAEIHSLYADAKKLRASAVSQGVDPTTGEEVEKIKNPMAFDRSIVRRADLLETAIKAVQEVWDLRTMQAFYETIIEEIGKESPEAQQRIMRRLAELNARAGMTLSMRV